MTEQESYRTERLLAEGCRKLRKRVEELERALVAIQNSDAKDVYLIADEALKGKGETTIG